jgi:hypothetical protein
MGEWAERAIQNPSLPLEILSEIFILTGAFLDINSSYEPEYIQWTYQSLHVPLNQLIALLLVCKDWHDATRATKELYQRQIRFGYENLRKPLRLIRYLRCINPHWPLAIELGAWPAHETTFQIFRGIFPILTHRIVRFVDGHGEAMEKYPFEDILHAPRLEVLEVTRFTYPGDNQSHEISPLTIPAPNFPALRVFICKTKHRYNTRYPKPGHRTRLLLVESPKLQELAYSKCYIAVDDWITQTKYSPNLKKVTLTRVEWYRTAEQSNFDRMTLAGKMVRYMSSLQTLAVRGLEIETEPMSFGIAVLDSMISRDSLAHLVILGLGANTPMINYPRCSAGVSKLTKVTLSFSSTLADERLSDLVVKTAHWLTTFPNLNELALEDDRETTRSPVDVTLLLDALFTRNTEANLLVELSHLSLFRCSFNPVSLLSLSRSRSRTPHGVLSATSRKCPIRVNLIGCRPYTGGKKTRESKLVHFPDVRDAHWEMLSSVFTVRGDQAKKCQEVMM